MRDNDDLLDIPSIAPAKDEVAGYRSKRKQSDIVPTPRYGEPVKASSWPVRVMLGLLTVGIVGGGVLAYQAYVDNQAAMTQALRRIEDLEGRLALVGDSTEETTANVIERLDFNFSEIDKLWAARNATNNVVNELNGKVTVLQQESTEFKETTDTLSELLARNAAQVEDAMASVNRLQTSMGEAEESILNLERSVQSVQSVAQDMANIRATLNNGDSSLIGLRDRLTNLEEAIESIDAYRLQVNQALNRLQQNIEAVQSARTAR